VFVQQKIAVGNSQLHEHPKIGGFTGSRT
jgi:hypothetical protein